MNMRHIFTALLCFTILASAEFLPALGKDRIVVCPKGDKSEDCDKHKIGDAFGWSGSNKTVIVKPGIYNEAFMISGNNNTIIAEPGAHIKDKAIKGKGAIVINGNNTVIEGLECSGIRVPSRNGACIRLQGKNLTLRNVYFHDSEEGLLAVGALGTITIENSKFERLGRGGRAHGIYINGAKELIVRNSEFYSSVDQGHEIKSRKVGTTIIENNIIASLEGDDSRLIDVASGNKLIVRNNILEEGPNSVNWNLISLNARGFWFEESIVENNTFIMDHENALVFWPEDQIARATIRNNVFIGPDNPGGDNKWYPNREAAGLPPYPALPETNLAASENSADAQPSD